MYSIYIQGLYQPGLVGCKIIELKCMTCACTHLLWRDIKSDSPQVHHVDFVQARQDKEEPGSLGLPRRQPTEAKDHGSLVLFHDLCKCVCVQQSSAKVRAQSLISYLDRHKQRKWKEHNDQYERNRGHNVAAASQPLLGRCSYLAVCREEKDCA